MKKSIILITTLLLFAATTFAQSGKLKRANKHFEKGNYEKAFWLYYEVLDKNDNDEAKIKGAYVCLKIKNYQGAEFWLGQTIYIENTPSEYILYYAACLIYNTNNEQKGLKSGNTNKYKLAKPWLKKFKDINSNDERLTYLEQVLTSYDTENKIDLDWNKIILE